MSCSAGYPEKPCPFEFKGKVTRHSCGTCKHFVPPQHILRWCMLWDREQTLCMKPIKACATCPEKAPLGKELKVDWKDPGAVLEYWREKAKRWGQENPDRKAAAMVRFLEKDPDYFKRYREQHREKMNEAVRRHRAKVREQRERSASDGQVQPDPRGPRSERDEDLPAPGSDDTV